MSEQPADLIDNAKRFSESADLSYNNISHLVLAFTHRSYLNERRGVLKEHNERLEFLGDAVLELVVTEFLYDTYPSRPEGELTAIRSAIVNTTSLSDAAQRLGMNDFLLLSKGEARDTGRARQFILANTFEAVIGSLYLDGGYEKAKSFIARELFPKADEIVKKRLWIDAKSAFQEKAQEHVGITPIYKVHESIGPDHDKSFVMGLYIGNELIATGDGKSKQEAEQKAAEAGLNLKNWDR